MPDKYLTDRLWEIGDSKGFSVSGIFWILLDTGRHTSLARFDVSCDGLSAIGNKGKAGA